MYADIENKLGVKIEDTKYFKAGKAGQTVSLKFENDDQRYVAKAYTDKNGLQELQREWAGLNFLYQANYPVPKPVLSNFAHEKPYILMQQIDGEDVWTAYEKAAPAARQELLTNFTRVFFDLHALDVSTLNQPPRTESTLDFIEKEISAIQTLAAEKDIQNVASVIGWLNREKGQVLPEKLSMLHRDYHPWNALADPRNQVYVIDLVWGIGDYRFDLAWFCALMERSSLEAFSDAAFSLYKEFRQSDINNFAYFKVLATLRWLMNVTPALETRASQKPEYDAFFQPLVQNAIQMLRALTQVEIAE